MTKPRKGLCHVVDAGNASRQAEFSIGIKDKNGLTLYSNNERCQSHYWQDLASCVLYL